MALEVAANQREYLLDIFQLNQTVAVDGQVGDRGTESFKVPAGVEDALVLNLCCNYVLFLAAVE